MFLAIYDPANLQCPSKVLTHAQDINRELNDAAIHCAHFEPEPDQAASYDDGQLLKLMEHLPPPAFPHWRLLRIDGPPGYVDLAQAQAESEKVCSEAARWAFLNGRGQLCLNLAGALLVLELGPGDLVDFPSGTQHWLRPASAERCVIMHMSHSVSGLDRKSVEGDLAERFTGFGP